MHYSINREANNWCKSLYSYLNWMFKKDWFKNSCFPSNCWYMWYKESPSFILKRRLSMNIRPDFQEMFRDSAHLHRMAEHNFSKDNVRDIDEILAIFWFWGCKFVQRSFETTQDIYFKLLRMIDLGLFVPFESQVSRSKSSETLELDNRFWKSVRFFLCFSAITLSS